MRAAGSPSGVHADTSPFQTSLLSTCCDPPQPLDPTLPFRDPAKTGALDTTPVQAAIQGWVHPPLRSQVTCCCNQTGVSWPGCARPLEVPGIQLL